jgi:uncharacterized protein DUF2784
MIRVAITFPDSVMPLFLHILADAIVVLHMGFVLFVVFGGFLVYRWPRMMWLHIPASAWGIAVEWAGWICPLTPLEDLLRERAGMPAYRGDFIEQYLLFVLYPSGLTRGAQFVLGSIALAVNVFIYWRLIARAV